MQSRRLVRVGHRKRHKCRREEEEGERGIENGVSDRKRGKADAAIKRH